MQQNNLFVESFSSESLGMSFGVLCINSNTFKQANNVLSQSMPCDDAHIEEIKRSILSNGYNSAFPIVLNSNMKTLDGYTRMKASLELVDENLVKQVLIPYYTANELGEVFNSASRGASAKDIEYMFSISRAGGLLTGKSDRAAEQAIEASQMLDVAKLDDNFEKAFAASKVQSHTSKIVREREAFVQSFKAVCEVATALDMNPNTIKWAHWMALFCRYGVNSVTKAIARKNLIANKGTTQKQRYSVFCTCEKEAKKLGGL